MADETTVEKHYCYACPTSDNSSLNPMLSALLTNQNQHDPMMSAMVANQNGNNQWMNNPFAYMMFMWMFRMFGGNGWGNGADAQAENFNSRQIAALQDTVNTNHNNELVLQAINGNRDALGQLAQTFNTDISTIQQACCGINASIKEVAGQVGFSAESVKNAIALGDANIVSKMQECCCSNKLLTQQMGYEAQLRDQANTAALTSRIDQLANGIQTGFAQIGYQSEKNTSAIIQAGNANTQRILDQMCANQTQSLRDAIADKDRQLQTQTLLNQLGGGCNCNS